MKTLKDMFEVYRPKSPDEQKFVDKHVTIKHKDRNEVNGKANGDDVFKATNIKPSSREATRHGYDIGDDEKVYEENEFFIDESMLEEENIDEVSKATLKKYSKAAKAQYNDEWEKGSLSPKMRKRGKMIDMADTKKSSVEKRHQKATGEPWEPSNPRVKVFSKEEIINRAIEKYMPEVADIKPLTMEQRLAKKLDGLSEGHTTLLFSLFSNLNEENQMKMIDNCEDMDGINELIDFALENIRGE